MADVSLTVNVVTLHYRAPEVVVTAVSPEIIPHSSLPTYLPSVLVQLVLTLS